MNNVNSDGVGKHIVEDEELFNSTSSVDEYKELLSIDSPKEEVKEEVEVEEEDSEVAELKELSEVSEEVRLKREADMKAAQESIKRLQNSSYVIGDAKSDEELRKKDAELVSRIKQEDMDRELYFSTVLKPWNGKYKFSDGEEEINAQNYEKRLSSYPLFGTLLNYYRSVMYPKLPIELVHGQLFAVLGSIMAGLREDVEKTYDNDRQKMIDGFAFNTFGAEYYAKVWIKNGSAAYTTNLGCLVLGNQGSGKDITKMERATIFSTPQNREGFMDKLVEEPSNLSIISELKPYLKEKDYNSTVMSAFKYLYDNGCMIADNSKYGGIQRKAPYSAPSMIYKTQVTTWLELLQDNSTLLSDGQFRRCSIDCCAEELVSRNPATPELPKTIKFNGVELELNDDINVIFDVYKKFTAEVKLKELPRRLIAFKEDIHYRMAKLMNEAERKTILNIWDVISSMINQLAIKYYIILNPVKGLDGKIDMDNDMVWDDVIFKILYDVQKSEKYLFRADIDEELNWLNINAGLLKDKFNAKDSWNITKLHQNSRVFKTKRGQRMNIDEFRDMIFELCNMDYGFRYDKDSKLLYYSRDNE
jgi:hypothetical protein